MCRVNKLGKHLSKSGLFFCDEVDCVRLYKRIVIKDQVLNATLLQTGDPMCGVAHPSKLEDRNAGDWD